MSGAIAAHAAYNGSGTQGLAVTNKIHESDGNVMSVFWNKNDTTRQLLYGSSIIEIPSSGASTLAYGSSRLFTVNNDIDCLGDIYLQIGEEFINHFFTLDSNVTYSYDNGNTFTISGTGVIDAPIYSSFKIIPRIEVQVGTQIWQTLENQDFEVLLSSELPLGCYTQTMDQADVSRNIDNAAFIRIPCLTKTLGPQLSKFSQQTEDGYPMAAAPHQSVKFKVYFADVGETALMPRDAIIVGLVFSPTESAIIIKYAIYGMRNMYFTIPDVSIASHTGANPPTNSEIQAALQQYINNDFYNTALGQLSEYVSNISSCKMYAKQQIMCNEEREQIKAMPMGLPKRLKMTQNAYLEDINGKSSVTMNLDHFSLYASHLLIASNASIKTAELKLNSSSFSGALPGTLLYSATSESLGIYCNRKIRGKNDMLYPVGRYNFYTFPLASTAYSGSSVPLNRFDSIRLTITFTDTFSGSVSVTCVGETTALFKDGAASLAMY